MSDGSLDPATLIPHRPPILCVDALVALSSDAATGTFLVRDGPLVQDGRLWELACIEGLAQTAAAIERLCDPASKVSSHYVVDEHGDIIQLVPEARRAWHAGESSWEGVSDINSRSVGIEIVNPGHSFGYPDFPDG